MALVFRLFVITSYHEALRNPQNERSALCHSRLSGKQGELQDLTPKWSCCADRFESNWSGQTMQTPDSLEVLANYEEAHEKSQTYKAQPKLMCSLCAWMSSWGPGSAERIAVALLCSREDNHSPGFRAAF